MLFVSIKSSITATMILFLQKQWERYYY